MLIAIALRYIALSTATWSTCPARSRQAKGVPGPAGSGVGSAARAGAAQLAMNSANTAIMYRQLRFNKFSLRALRTIIGGHIEEIARIAAKKAVIALREHVGEQRRRHK